MSALPPNRQIQFNSIPGAPPWFAGFLTGLNQFLAAVYDMMNASVTAPDNLPWQYKTLTIDGSATSASFACSLKVAPREVVVAQVKTLSGTPTGTNFAIGINQWSYSAGTVTIGTLVGLQAGVTYQITFRVA